MEYKNTDFGFKKVSADEHTGMVKSVFESVAGSYDLMNDLMSGGMHRLWKRDFVANLRPRAGEKILDLAGGTGDIALKIKKNEPAAEVVICDINADMLNEGRNRAIDKGLADYPDVTCGNAEVLPFPDKTFDACTIAFGIRNVTRKDVALKEIFRVLKTGGRFYCLEFSKVHPILTSAYDAYLFKIVPKIGRIAAGNEEAYRYLAESIDKFPSQPEFAKMITAPGFGRVTYRNLAAGVVAVHSGWKL